MPRDELPGRTERADPDHRVERVRVHVRDGREVQVHADLGEIRSDRRRHLLGELDVVDGAEGGVSRVGAAGGGLEPRHVAALLVDPDEDGIALRPERSGQGGELLAALDVPREEDDPAEPLPQPTKHPVRRARPLEAREDAREREPVELGGCHPLTEPAVSPNAILRCTSRKKITTGIAVSVDAAISAPQSVFRLDPVKYESQIVSVWLF